MTGKFERDVVRSVWVAREQIEHLFAIPDSTGMNFLA
jgi:hypothetical protein